MIHSYTWCLMTGYEKLLLYMHCGRMTMRLVCAPQDLCQDVRWRQSEVMRQRRLLEFHPSVNGDATSACGLAPAPAPALAVCQWEKQPLWEEFFCPYFHTVFGCCSGILVVIGDGGEGHGILFSWIVPTVLYACLVCVVETMERYQRRCQWNSASVANVSLVGMYVGGHPWQVELLDR